MKTFALLLLASLASLPLAGQTVAERVATDGAIVDRLAEASKRDLPVSLLERIVKEDIELMRGLRPDGTYEHAARERFEAARITDTFTVKPGQEMQTFELKGAFVYRLILDVPGRRLVVRRNLPVWVERVDVEYLGESSRNERTSIEVKAWIQPGVFRPVDLPVVTRQATVRVIASADPKGSGKLAVSLIQARVVDNPDSPYAGAVTGAKAVLKALENNDIPALRQAAQKMRDEAGGGRTAAGAPVADSAQTLEMQAELQLIEDLLTGTETERREGMDRLHQIIRRLR